MVSALPVMVIVPMITDSILIVLAVGARWTATISCARVPVPSRSGGSAPGIVDNCCSTTVRAPTRSKRSDCMLTTSPS